MKKITLPVIAVAALFVLPASALGGSLASPVVKISSTKGSGSGGCVKSSKLVLFTYEPVSPYYYLTSATVKLDGRIVKRKTFTGVPVPAFLGAPTRKFAYAVDLAHSNAGGHTITYTGVVGQLVLVVRRPGAHTASTFTRPTAPNYDNGKIVQTARITKCAAFTG